MNSDTRWRTSSLYELAEYVNGRATKPSEVVRTGVPVVKIADLRNGFGAKTNYVPEESVQARHWIHEGDLLFAWSGSVGIHIYRGPDAALNQHIFRVVAKEGIDQRFLRYLLISQMATFESFVENKKTTMGHVTVRDLKATEVSIPPLPQQHHIAHILGTLDDKIELNRRMNETLEEMARAIFKDWFVDFGPVRAKMEGREAYLPEEIWRLFPDRLVDSELGEVPEGWGVKSLDEIANYRNGLALQKFRPEPVEEHLPVVKIAQLRSGVAGSGEWATSSITPECIIDDGDVVFSWSGSLLVKIWTGGRAALNQHLFKVTSNDYPKWFYLHLTKHHLAEFQSIAADKTTTMGHIKRQHLREARCAVPIRELISIADESLRDLIDQSVANQKTANRTGELRDALLPTLVSGQTTTQGNSN